MGYPAAAPVNFMKYDIETEHLRFEEWARKHFDSPEDFYYTHQGTGYYPNNLHIAWMAWLAALDSTEGRNENHHHRAN